MLKVNFEDVQQGDGCIIETPAGRVVLVDGGDNQMFARYLAARFRETSAARPKSIDAIVVTHGDADHFAGLTKIYASERNENPKKRLFIHPERIFHNGIFKRPGERADGKKRSDLELLNDTVKRDGLVYLSPLVNDPSELADDQLNKPFRKWKEAIKAWKKRGEMAIRRLEIGDNETFDFLKSERVEVEVLGPLTEEIGGRPALRFLGEPPKGPRLGHEVFSTAEEEFKGHSASHTINGHSVVLRLTYGGFSFLLTGDLNDQSERIHTCTLRGKSRSDRRRAESSPSWVVGGFFAGIRQGSEPDHLGDFQRRRVGAEGIHPSPRHARRVAWPLLAGAGAAGLLHGTGRILQTNRLELQASSQRSGTEEGEEEIVARSRYYGFQRSAYGMVKIRTDGERLLVSMNSGKDDMKEAYAYQRDEHGEPVASRVRAI